jgi:hypothetical protein
VLDREWLQITEYSKKGGGTNKVPKKTFPLVPNAGGGDHVVINTS